MCVCVLLDEHLLAIAAFYELILNYMVMYACLMYCRGSMGVQFLPQSYVYVHVGVFACGLWAIACQESTDSVIMVSYAAII